MRRSEAKRLGHISDMQLADAQIQDLAFQLLTIYYADPAIKRLLSKFYLAGIRECFDEIKKDKITLLLVQIASLHRVRHWKETKRGKIRVADPEVGTLFVEGIEQNIGLTMLEACNKIIHAEHIKFEVRKVRKSPLHYFRDAVIIEGAKGKRRWAAYLTVTHFCDAAMFGPDWIDVPF